MVFSLWLRVSVRKVVNLWQRSVAECKTLTPYIQGSEPMHLKVSMLGGRQAQQGSRRRWSRRVVRPGRPMPACRGRQDANRVIGTWYWSAMTVLTVLTLTEINNKSLWSGRSWKP